jgi:hypothetical protein
MRFLKSRDGYLIFRFGLRGIDGCEATDKDIVHCSCGSAMIYEFY